MHFKLLNVEIYPCWFIMDAIKLLTSAHEGAH